MLSLLDMILFTVFNTCLMYVCLMNAVTSNMYRIRIESDDVYHNSFVVELLAILILLIACIFCNIIVMQYPPFGNYRDLTVVPVTAPTA